MQPRTTSHGEPPATGPLPPRTGRLLLAASVALVLVATLTPAPGHPTLPVGWCLVCGEHGTADALANLLLFMPLGIAGFLLGWRSLPVAAGALLLSASVEIVQLALPGRDPSLGDVLCNTAGAPLGLYAAAAALSLKARWLPAWTPAAAAVIVMSVVLAAGALLRPLPPTGEYYGQWTARLGHLGSYEGRVSSATLGGMPLPGHRFPDGRPVARLLRAGAPLEVHATTGPPPTRLAPLFSIFTGNQEEVLLLGFDGRDVVYRLRRASEALRLDAPDLRVRGLVGDIAPPGSPLGVRVQRQGTGYCLAVNSSVSCGLGWTAGRIWAVVYYETRLARFASLLDALCIGLLVLPVGLTLRRNAWAAVALVVSAAALYLVPPWVGLLRATSAETAAAAAVLLLPGLIAAYGRERRGRPSSTPVLSARASASTQRSMRV